MIINMTRTRIRESKKTMKTTSILITVALGTALCGLTLSAKETRQDTALTRILKSVPAPELPAKAATLVREADPQAQQFTTIAVIKSAVEVNPAAAPLVVGAVSKRVPEMAPAAAATAAALQPKQATLIARAAAAAAPTRAGQIVEAVCKQVPTQYRTVALAVVGVAPNASKEIISGVASAIPSLKLSIDQAVPVYGTSPSAVSQVLDNSSKTVAPSLAMLPKPPTITPPYHALTMTPTNVTPATSFPVINRNYAEP